MKLILSLLVCVAAVNQANAGSWATDDDYVGGTAAVATGAMSDGTYLYVVGGDNYGANAIVRRRSVTSSGWTTVDTYTGDGTAGASAIAIDQQFGLIYVVGSTAPAVPNAQTSRWYVRRSKDHGQNWDTIHIGSYFPNGKNYASSVRISARQVVVALTAYDSNNIGSWVIKTDANNWGTPLDVVAPAGVPQGTNAVAAPSKMAFDGAGNLFVTGMIFDTNGLHWITRKSSAPFTWSTIDDTTNREGFGAVAVNGKLYTIGENLNVNRWITRESDDGGVTWNDVDTYQAAFITEGTALRDFGTSLFACGTDANAWGVRVSTDGGATWTSSDRYYLNVHHQGGEANDMWPFGGKLWTVGSIYDGSISHWIVRSYTP